MDGVASVHALQEKEPAPAAGIPRLADARGDLGEAILRKLGEQVRTPEFFLKGRAEESEMPDALHADIPR